MTKIIVSKKHSLKGHRDGIYALTGSNDPDVFFSAGSDGYVAKWDLNDPENGRLIAKLPTSIYAMYYYEPENLLVVGQNFDGIHLIDLDQMKETGSLKLTKSAIFDVKVWDDKILVATGDGWLIVIDRHSLNVVQKIQMSEKSARCIAINTEQHEVAVGYSDHMIRIFKGDDFSLVKEIEGHKNSVFTLAYSPDQKFLISAGRDAHLKFWDVQHKYELAESIVAHMYAINHIAFSSSGRYFATCSMDKSVKLWDAEKRKLLKVIDKARHAGHGTSVNRLIWAEQPGVLLSGSDDRLISVWQLEFNP